MVVGRLLLDMKRDSRRRCIELGEQVRALVCTESVELVRWPGRARLVEEAEGVLHGEGGGEKRPGERMVLVSR